MLNWCVRVGLTCLQREEERSNYPTSKAQHSLLKGGFLGTCSGLCCYFICFLAGGQRPDCSLWSHPTLFCSHWQNSSQPQRTQDKTGLPAIFSFLHLFSHLCLHRLSFMQQPRHMFQEI